MALAAAEPGTVVIDRNQRHEDEIGLDDRVALGRLHDAERARLKRVAGEEAERLGGIVESRETRRSRRRRALPPSPEGTDLAAEWAVAADDRNSGEQRRQAFGEAASRAKRDRRRTESRRTPCARPAPRGAATPWTAAPFQAADRAGRGVTGPPWPFALKSSDAKTSGGRRVSQARAQAGTAPKWIISPQGFSEGAHRVVPVATGDKLRRAHAQGPRQAIRAARRAIRRARTSSGSGSAGAAAAARRGFWLLVDQLVGEQKPGEQELARFGQGAEAGRAPRGSWRRAGARRCCRFSSSPSRQAT